MPESFLVLRRNRGRPRAVTSGAPRGTAIWPDGEGGVAGKFCYTGALAMKITRETVLYVADLAHLELSESEIETYLPQLDQILTYVEKLNSLDTSGVDPLAQVVAAGTRTPWRDDQVRQSGVTEDALAAAPDARPPFFRVPKVIERES